jgi:type III restriction enzyme/adenine-specific DNA-methyltransferase
MIKDIEKDNENVAINTKEIAVLKEHFPACFKKDGSFDIERFKEELKDKVDVVHEGYELKFLGKSYAKLLASLDTTTVITPNIAHNNLPENKNSENIYISGDNLDGLKHLLKSYSKSVKCIYIDPPYNTGSDGFVYKDNFNFTADELQDKLSVDETQANRIIDLTKRNSASHSAWLMFMYSRLQLAKDLLKDDGVIFISIDENEQANLKLLCDDVFGEENFIDILKWKKKKQPSFLATHTAKIMEYVLVYAKQKDKLEKLSIEGTSDATKKVINVSNKECQRIFKKNVRVKGVESRVIKAGRYKIKTMEIEYCDDVIVKNGFTTNEIKVISKFSVSQDKITNYIDNGLLFITAQNGLRRDVSIEEIGKRKSITDLLLSDWGDNQESDKEFIELFGEKYFDYNKPIDLVKNLIISNFTEDEIVLDFFSGSATTAESVMRANNDDGNRKYIMIQLPEKLEESLLAASSDDKVKIKKVIDFLISINRPKTLDYIGIERIIRASKKIQSEAPDLFNEESKNNGDYGFKHFILNEPKQNTLDKCETFDKVGLLADATILDDFGAETVLTTWLNYDGYGFNAKVQTIDLNGYEAYYCNKHLYLINPDFSQNSVVALFEKYDTISSFNPENIVLFGYSFIEWSVTEMLEKNLKILNDSEKNLKINIDVRY